MPETFQNLSATLRMKSNWIHKDATIAFQHYRDDWDRLNIAMYESNPYFDSKFVQNLIKHFPVNRLTLCVYCPKDTVEGLLLIHPARFGKWSIYKPAQAQIAPVLIHDESQLKLLMKSLSLSTIALDCLCQDPLSSILAPTVSIPHSVTDYAHTVNTVIDSDFEEFWQSRAKKLRQNVDRRLRRINEMNREVTLHVLTDPESMRDSVMRYGEMESRGWKGTAGTAVHIDNNQGRFYADLMHDFAHTGNSTVYELCFDDSVVAMRLSISSHNMLVMLKTTYDEDFSKLSPGRLLLYKVLELEYMKRRYETIEYYTNANSDLVAWTNSERWIRHYTLFRSAAAARIRKSIMLVRRE